METILLPAGKLVTVRSTARLGGQGGRKPSKIPVSWGIQLSRIHGNIRKSSFVVRGDFGSKPPHGVISV